ncbi:YgzB family protein [Fervidibacillus halotolerans]|uniref:YgzB family protein n=1 Tax=Fervidibacillus halotolerans TaxID=2980027 RepID=A0A9E8M071_9BACI|nr:YgzB family protein [Fervidibacillus halotolerans]WAA12942.1 YgzB family protein [Fervidibacillus halotolerans]
MGKYPNKINKIRTFALSLVFLGIFIMYIGIFLKKHPYLMLILMILGFLSVIASAVVYIWIGMLSVKAVQVICPSCGKVTKILGKADICMHCNEALTLDKSLEGKDFEEAFHRKQ